MCRTSRTATINECDERHRARPYLPCSAPMPLRVSDFHWLFFANAANENAAFLSVLLLTETIVVCVHRFIYRCFEIARRTDIVAEDENIQQIDAEVINKWRWD